MHACMHAYIHTYIQYNVAVVVVIINMFKVKSASSTVRYKATTNESQHKLNS